MTYKGIKASYVIHIRFREKSICRLRSLGNQSLSLKLDELRPWIHSSFFSQGAKKNSQFLLGYTILMRGFTKKRSICSLRFVWNQSLSLKQDELRSWIESSFFLQGPKKNGQFSLGHIILMCWFHEKSICSLRFVQNQSLSLKWDELRPWIESIYFS